MIAGSVGSTTATGDPLPSVSVIMPVYNEESNIAASIAGVLGQDYPADRMEILVADGGSTDRTRDRVLEIARDNPRWAIRILDNPGKFPGNGLNVGIRRAAGEILVRVDGHCIIDRRHVRDCVEALRNGLADNVGGRFAAVGETWFGRAVALATTSRIGNGGARYRYSHGRMLVDTVPLGAWRAETFRRFGLFLEGIRAAEDVELNYRIRGRGGRVLLLGHLPIRYLMRSNPLSLGRQYFTFGRSKTRILGLHPTQARPRHIAAVGLTACGLFLLLCTLFFRGATGWLWAGGAAYLAIVLGAALGAAARGGWRYLPAIPVALGVVHVAYAAGCIAGLVEWVAGHRLSSRPPTETLKAASASAPTSSSQISSHRLRLAILEDPILYRANGSYTCDDPHILFLQNLADRFLRATLCARIAPGMRKGRYSIDRDGLEIWPMPHYGSLPDFFRHPIRRLRAAHAAILPVLLRSDVLWMAWPHPLSLWLLRFLRRRRLPVAPVLVVRQNLPVRVGHRYTGWRRPLAILTARVLDAQLARVCPEALILTVGEEMRRSYGKRFRHVHAVEMARIPLRDLPTDLDVRRPLRRSRLLYVGRLDPEKGVRHLLHATAALHAEGRPVTLVLAGEGTEEAALRAMVDELGIGSLISFRGHVVFGPALYDQYREADLFVLPSLTEGFPQALREALLFGLPAVATRVGGIPAVIATGKNGWLVEPGSAEELCRGIRTLLDDPDLCERIRRSGREGAENFTMESQRDRMLDLVARSVIERTGDAIS
jgi:glycosyltransferase involved in cell wall biosynthesis